MTRRWSCSKSKSGSRACSSTCASPAAAARPANPALNDRDAARHLAERDRLHWERAEQEKFVVVAAAVEAVAGTASGSSASEEWVLPALESVAGSSVLHSLSQPSLPVDRSSAQVARTVISRVPAPLRASSAGNFSLLD